MMGTLLRCAAGSSQKHHLCATYLNGHPMAEKKKTRAYKHFNRAMSISELAERAIEPLAQKRGFANAELLTRWAHIVPEPFDQSVIPDQLKWPHSGQMEGAAGAVLTVSVDPIYALAFTHETDMIKGAINRYFGFYLVDKIKPSRRPFLPQQQEDTRPQLRPLTPKVEAELNAELDGIEDAELREALMKLGRGLKGRG
ncbi:DUF721 domain-containing protein [Maritalea mobilis]|nr:DciA family protein [Maritalea mobilis]